MMACTSPQKHSASVNGSALDEFAAISIGSSMIQVMELKGRPYKNVIDEKQKITVLAYLQKGDERETPRETFFFNNEGKLFSKSFYIFDGEAERALEFWKKRYPATELNVVRKMTRPAVDAYSYEEHIDVGPNQRLRLNGNKVTAVSWSR